MMLTLYRNLTNKYLGIIKKPFGSFVISIATILRLLLPFLHCSSQYLRTIQMAARCMFHKESKISVYPASSRYAG